MQNAGQPYGQGGASSHQTAPFGGSTETTPSGGSITSSLRQFRRKNEDKQALSDNNNSSTPTESHVARVAPHSHYPPRTTSECYRYPPQYPDYGLQQPVKYSEISEPHPPLQEHISPSVIQKPKGKEYMEMCNVQQAHMKPTYDHLNGQQGYPEANVHPHQYLHKEPQVHPAYKTESQYFPKDPQYSPQMAHHQLPKYSMGAQVRKYPPENDFLSKLRRIHPNMARSIMSDHHMQESQNSYQTMEQNRIYPHHQNQRYMNYPGNMQNNAYPHGYMPYSSYSSSCSYNRPPQIPPRFPPVNPHERSVSPRRGYPDNMGVPMNYGGIPSQKIPPNYPQYNTPEYAQHYQHRRVAMTQEYYQQHCSPAQYLPPHQMPPQDISEGRVTVSDSIKHYIENWEDEETASEMNQLENSRICKDGIRNREDQSTETLYIMSSSELQYLENGIITSDNGMSVPVVTSETGQYIIKPGVALENGSEIVRIMHKSSQMEIDPATGERVVNLHIMDPPSKPDCMLANKPNESNQRQVTDNSYITGKPRVVIHQNTVISSGKETSEGVGESTKMGTSLPIITDTLEEELTRTIISQCRKETADKNCSPINLNELEDYRDEEVASPTRISTDSLVEEIASIQEIPDLSKNIPFEDAHENTKTENDESHNENVHKDIKTLLDDTVDHTEAIEHRELVENSVLTEDETTNNNESSTSTSNEENLLTTEASINETEQQSTVSDNLCLETNQTSVIGNNENKIDDEIKSTNKTESEDVKMCEDAAENSNNVKIKEKSKVLQTSKPEKVMTKRSRRIFSVDDIINNIGKKLKQVETDNLTRRNSLKITKEFLEMESKNTFKFNESASQSQTVSDKEDQKYKSIDENVNKSEDVTEGNQSNTVDCIGEDKQIKINPAKDTVEEMEDTNVPDEIIKQQERVENDVHSSNTEDNIVEVANETNEATTFKNSLAVTEFKEDHITDEIENSLGRQEESSIEVNESTTEHTLHNNGPVNQTKDFEKNITESMLEQQDDLKQVPQEDKKEHVTMVEDRGNLKSESEEELSKKNSEDEPLPEDTVSSRAEDRPSSSPTEKAVIIEEFGDSTSQQRQDVTEEVVLNSHESTISKEEIVVLDQSMEPSSVVQTNEYATSTSYNVEQGANITNGDISLLSVVSKVPDQAEVQYRNVIRVEESSVLLEIAGELVEINVNSVNGKNIITVVPLSDTAVVDCNDNYESFDNAETGDPLKLDDVSQEHFAAVVDVISSEAPDTEVVETTSEIIIGMDLSLEEEIQLDIDQPPVLCTKASKKAYDCDLQIPSITTSGDVRDNGRFKIYNANDRVSSTKHKMKKVKKKPKPDSSKRTDMRKRINSKSEKISLFRDLIAARNRKKMRLETSKDEEEEFVPFKDLVKARKLRKNKLKKLKNNEDYNVDSTIKIDEVIKQSEISNKTKESRVEVNLNTENVTNIETIKVKGTEENKKSCDDIDKGENIIEHKHIKRVSFSDINEKIEATTEKNIEPVKEVVVKELEHKLEEPRINKQNDCTSKKKLSLEEYNRRKRIMHETQNTENKKVKINRHHSTIEPNRNNPERIKLHRPKSLDDIHILKSKDTSNKRKFSLEYSPVKQNYFDWEETQSPKVNLMRKESGSKICEFKGLIANSHKIKTKAVIDVNEFNSKPSMESSEDEILQNYKEQVESKLSSLNFQIPRPSKNLDRRIPDPFSRTETNSLIERFLNNEKLNSDEMEKIRKIISYKRLMQQLKKIKSHDLSRTTTLNPAYEVRKELTEKQTKLLLKKVGAEKRKNRLKSLNSHSESELDRDKTKCSGDYSVVQSNCLAGVVPKLIIKRKTEMPLPFVMLERLDLALLDEKNKKDDA